MSAQALAPPSEDEIRTAQQDLLAPPSEDELRQASVEVQAEQASPLAVGAEAALSSATLGLTDEARIQFLANQQAREQAISEGLTPSDVNRRIPQINPEFDQRVSELAPQFAESERQRLLAERQASPVATTTGEIAGALSPVGPAAGVFRLGAKAAKGLLPAQVAGSRIASGAAQAAGGGAAFEAARAPLQQGTGLSEPVDAGEAAALGGALGAAPGVLGATGRGIKAGIKAGFRSTFGVTDKAIESVLKNPKLAKEVGDTEKFRETLKEQATNLVDDVKRNAQESKLDTADEIQAALETIKERIITKSEEAFELIGNSNAKIDRKVLQRATKAAKAKLFIAGKAPIGQSAKQAVRKIENFEKGIQGLPDEIDATDVKNIIRQIDKDVSFLQIPGSFDDNLGQVALKNIRREINEELKDKVPGLAEKNKELQILSQLSKESSKRFGGQEKALSALSSLGRPNKEIKDQALQNLAKETNVDLDRFRRAQQSADLFKNWNGGNIGSKLRSLSTKGVTDEVKQAFNFLSKQSDTDFQQAVEKLQVATQFENEFLRGSRNVNLWAVIGGASSAGRVAGGGGVGFFLGGPAGALAGAAFGALIDTHGPRMARSILQQVGNIKGMPTVRKINQALDLPEKVKTDVRDSFVRSMLIGTSDEDDVLPTFIPMNQRQDVMNEIQLADHLDDLEKAQMLTSLNQKGEVQNLRKLALGDASVRTPKPPGITAALEAARRKKPQPARSVQNAAEFIEFRRKQDF